MFKAVWDEANNSVKLDVNDTDKEFILSRPVFFEELDLLGFSDFWEYPRTKEPLLWAIGRDYYYKGVLVGQVIGGDLYEKPEVNIIFKGRLEPIDIQKTIENNTDALNNLVGESLEFIRSVKKDYSKPNSQMTVAFSGGKDSQVILDLVSRVLNPDEYIVIYTDTGMEIPFVKETISYTNKHYSGKYPRFEFYTAKPKQDTHKLWEYFGPPSQKLRWCCSVCKSVPFVQTLRKHVDMSKLSNTIVFEGVRAEESSRRKRYNRLAEDVKHINLINARPILDWSITEVFLYLLQRNIEINKAYRYGMWRVGCSVCPFASKPANYYLGKLFKEQTDSFVKHIHKLALSRGMTDENKIKRFVADRSWAARSGGMGIDDLGVSNDIIITDNLYKAVLRKPRENILEWLKTLGKLSVVNREDETDVQLLIDNVYIQITIKLINESTISLTSSNINEYPVIRGLLTKIVNKATYCVHCGLCEAECPINAISFNTKLKIDNKCVHCHKCSKSIDKGCILAQSLSLPKGGGKMKKSSTGFDRYKKFGMREVWLHPYMSDPNNWFENNTLGSEQIPSFRRWLRDADFIDNKNAPTELVDLLVNNNDTSIWQIIWNNLYYNSPIVNWFVSLPFYTPYTKNELLEILVVEFPEIARSTLNNPLSALLNTFDNSPLGSKLKIGELEKKGRTVSKITKHKLSELSTAALIYSLYKFAVENNRYYFTLRELFNSETKGSPANLFGLSEDYIVPALKGLQEYDSDLIKVDFIANLDNINLNDELNNISALKRYLQKG
ncbi:MAG: phosphoadenosine phosphosulfate reductase family protein [Bacilli bacterium]|nr:phosphoadenosine phosphosulfate reductase family protein [Bacilli bacterium]